MLRALSLRLSVLLPLATLAVYFWLVLGPTRELMILAEGLSPPDLRLLGYDLPAIRVWLIALSPEGAALYLGPAATLDTLLPLLMGLTLLWWSRPVPGRAGWLFPAICAVAALAYMALDLAENAAVAVMVRAGPYAIDAGQVVLASNLTQAKFAAFALALVLAARQVWRRRRMAQTAFGAGGTSRT